MPPKQLMHCPDCTDRRNITCDDTSPQNCSAITTQRKIAKHSDYEQSRSAFRHHLCRLTQQTHSETPVLPGKVTEKPFWLGQTSFLLTVKHVSPQTATSGAPQQGAEVRSWCAKGVADFLGPGMERKQPIESLLLAELEHQQRQHEHKVFGMSISPAMHLYPALS